MARRSLGDHLVSNSDDTRSKAEDRGSPLRRRTRSREIALQALYQLDLLGSEDQVLLDEFVRRSDDDFSVQEFALNLVRGCWGRIVEIDQQIESVAHNWELRRMATVDRNILRLAAHELLNVPDIPAKVSINEAIDLAKKYSTAESGAFVNGILDKIRATYVASK